MMKDIAGYEGIYAVTDTGEVWSYRRKRFLKPSWSNSNSGKDFKGYLQVGLCVNGERRWKKVSRLVAEAFIPNPNNLPEVDHIDSDRSNNSVSNLQWISKQDNLSKRRNIKLVKCLENGKIYNSINEAAKDLNLNVGSISHVINGKMKQTGGYHFESVKEMI